MKIFNGPESVIGVYVDSKLNLNPRKFNVTSRWVMGDPSTGCKPLKNIDEVANNIVVLYEGKGFFLGIISLFVQISRCFPFLIKKYCE